MLCPMFIRRTRTRTGERGEVYYSHRLVRSERSGEKVRQRTLLNLGSDFPVERRHWAVLCSRIQQLLDRQAELVPLSCPEEVERHAQRIAAQLLNSAPSGGTGRPDLQTVDVGSLELIRPRSVGVEHVGLWAMERLGLEALLERLGFNGTQRALAMATVIARMAAPGSERASWRWLCERSALGELLGVDFERMSMMRLYRVSDALVAQRAAIEAQLFDRATDLFGLRSTVTLYDLTNTFFEGAAAAQPKAERGHSKEKRGDCPLLTLGLVLDGSGFVRRSEVFSGAVNEDKTLASMLKALGAPSDALVVMDAGIATEANIAWLRENGYRYLAVRGSVSGGLRLGRRWLGGDPDNRSLGPWARLGMRLSNSTRLDMDISALHRKHDTRTFLDGWRIAVRPTLRYTLDAQTLIEAEPTIEVASARTEHNGSRQIGFGVTASRAFDGGFSASVNPAFHARRYKDRHPLFGRQRVDLGVRIGVRVLHRSVQYAGFAPYVGYSFERTRSNIQIYGYRNHGAIFGVTRSF